MDHSDYESSYQEDIQPDLSPKSTFSTTMSYRPEASSSTLRAPERPPARTTNSTEPLLNDLSASNSPSLEGQNPFEGIPRQGSFGSDNSSNPPQPPQIQVNSIPNSPDSIDIPGFQPDIITSSPFNEKQSPAKVSGYTPNPIPSTIAERRAQRLRNVAPSLRSGKSGKSGKHSVMTSKTGPSSASRKPFQSTRLKGEIYKPWLEKKDPAQRWARWITLACIIIGFGIMGAICYDGYAAVPNLGKICSVLSDDFSNGLDLNTWTREVRLDGYGNGEFEWTTSSDTNSFVQDGKLYIVPTLTSDVLDAASIVNGYTLNLTADGTCTSSNVSQCVAISNSSLLTVINPVQSARLITKNSVSIKYGKVEVVARFPTGDWIWPSIFMLPVNETYGAWPRSGEIDILEGRGNNASYPNRGVDYAQSSLHWGPTTDLDRLYLTWGYREQRRTYYNQQFHTFGLEWNENYMWTYIDTRVSQVISLRFNKQSFWNRGNFPSTIMNDSTVVKLTNPWIQSPDNVAPFDQAFYLVIDAAVGGTDGWFPDGEGGKPWLDDSLSSMSDFWAAKDKWYPTWPTDKTQRGFAIDSVKMWKTC